MRKTHYCIFCNQDSTESKSIEHIIPESLGNDELILDKGNKNNRYAIQCKSDGIAVAFAFMIEFLSGNSVG